MASVSFRDVEKSFGAVSVLKNVSLEIQDGEFVVLVGPSGCGKSTLLRMLAGLEDITGGEIAIGESIVNDLKPKERDIAMVFQSYALYPHLTVEQNMGFSLRIKGEPKPVIKAAVAKAAGILGLEALLERYPRELSGGQRQRVAMGRAIVRDPEVFLFDEPLSNLDAKLRVQMRTEIKELHQRLRTTTVFVTHDQVEAMTMADRIVVMQGGVIEQTGAPLDLYDRPANTFVASFIGSPAMNMLEGELCDGETPFVDVGSARFPVPGAPRASIGKRVIAGIRPEEFRVAAEGIGARVTVVEPTGSEMFVQAMLGDTAVAVLLRERHDLRPGDDLTLGVAPGAIHLFDKATGLRLEG